MSKIQSIRGMNDILPKDIHKWNFFEDTVKNILHNYCYQEIRLPILEKKELFHRVVGISTDIIEKETYNFVDRGNEVVALRPEGTASCVRSMIESGLIYDKKTQKVWYVGPMFRYERPQQGRYRQFHQLGVEVYGDGHISQDAEVLSLSWKLLQALNLKDYVKLELNNLGNFQARSAYAKALVNYLTPIKHLLDKDSQSRLYKNPLRILDSKNKNVQELLDTAPNLNDFIDTDTKKSFHTLINYIEDLKIPYRINPHLVRGIDYYHNTVFEWVTESLGPQNTICAGGRYDLLVSYLGGPKTSAIGFAMGIERIILLLEIVSQIPVKRNQVVHIHLVTDEDSILKAMLCVEKLRHSLPSLNIKLPSELGSFKSQFKKADKSDAILALIIGENEIKDNTATIKFLREERCQKVISQTELINHFQEYFSCNKNQ